MNVHIYLINQNVDAILLADHAGRETSGKIVFCCTHALFPDERAAVSKLIADRLEIVEWADVVSDADAHECDDHASAALSPRLAETGFREHYPGYHMDASGRCKNILIHHELQRRYPRATYHHSDGLGIIGGYWLEQGSRELPPEMNHPSAVNNSDRGEPASDGYNILTVRLPDHPCAYVFVTDTRRLHFHPDTHLDCRRIDQHLDDLITSGRPWASLLEKLGLDGGSISDLRLATTIHGYRANLMAFKRPVHVFLDGYHPPNYPRAYLDYYDPTVIFEAREPISCEWFWRHGRSCRINPHLLAPVRFQPPEVRFGQGRPVILFALNHAGNWSALINCSDTDRLVMAAVSCAQNLPMADVILRPHPTMALPAHEGVRSRHRIEEYVQGCQHANLSVSQSSLEVDLNRSDVVVSEYSQVLIDAIASGRLGITVNLTGRRSFLATYCSMGLMEVTSAETLIESLSNAIDSPDRIWGNQGVLAANYNRLHEAVDHGCRYCSSHTIGWGQVHQELQRAAPYICLSCGQAFDLP